jgi:hypothetical protein
MQPRPADHAGGGRHDDSRRASRKPDHNKVNQFLNTVLQPLLAELATSIRLEHRQHRHAVRRRIHRAVPDPRRGAKAWRNGELLASATTPEGARSRCRRSRPPRPRRPSRSRPRTATSPVTTSTSRRPLRDTQRVSAADELRVRHALRILTGRRATLGTPAGAAPQSGSDPLKHDDGDLAVFLWYVA